MNELTSVLIHMWWNVALFLPLFHRIWVQCWLRHDGNSKSYIRLLKLPLLGWILHLQINKKHYFFYTVLTRAIKVNKVWNQLTRSVTYNNCFWIWVSHSLLQSMEECSRHFTHCLHVGKQSIYIYNLTEDKETLVKNMDPMQTEQSKSWYQSTRVVSLKHLKW